MPSSQVGLTRGVGAPGLATPVAHITSAIEHGAAGRGPETSVPASSLL